MALSGICWKSFESTNVNHTQNLVDMGFKFLRIFINLADFPQEQVNQAYIHKIMNMQDGKWAWDNFSKRWWSSPVNERVKAAFDFCKKNNWIPICCFGHSEEQDSWIGRNPSQDKWLWLNDMAMEFADYLQDVYGFIRADMECWNEPNECMPPQNYAEVAKNMFIGWKSISPDYKTHAFASNIEHQAYLDNLLSNINLMKVTDYISPHCISDKEWDSNLIDITYQKCLSKGKKVSLLEISPLGKMDRLNQMVGKCDMYAIVLAIRNSLIGQNDGITIDDLLIYDFYDTNKFIAITIWKMKWIKEFNNKYFNDIIPIGEEDMKLDKIYKMGSKGIGVRFIQKVLNVDIKPKPLLITDGIWGLQTTNVVKQYQTFYGLLVDGIVGPQTMKSMILEYPEIWNEIEYEWAIGVR